MIRAFPVVMTKSYIFIFSLRFDNYGRPQQILFDKWCAELNFTVSVMKIVIPKIITSYDD